MLLAELAIEYWKMLRALERNNDLLPDSSKERFAAQARYAAGRLEAILAKAGFRVVSFDGQTFEVNLPAVAINPEDVGANGSAIVERTLEPAIVADTKIVIFGKVLLAPNE